VLSWWLANRNVLTFGLRGVEPVKRLCCCTREVLILASSTR